MSSRVAVAQFQGTTPSTGRQAKKVNVPVVPNMTVVEKNRYIDEGVKRDLGCRSRASPSQMSNYHGSDSQNSSRNSRPTIFETNSPSSFSCYGTDAAHLLGTKSNGMTSLAFPSTSVLPDPSHRISTGSNSSQGSSGFESMKSHVTGSASSSSSSSFHTVSLLTSSQTDSPPSRISVHSSGSGGSGSSSLASSSVDTLDYSFCSPTSESPVNVTQMVAKRIPEAEILAIWLDKIGMADYLALFLTQGYDLSSIARITPEDLLSLGITNPAHRKRLINEIHSWQVTDSWPSVPPEGGLSEWLTLLALPEYVNVFLSQGYDSVEEVMELSWEDFEDIGIKRLGHLKRLGLAIKKLKDYQRSMNNQLDTLSNSGKVQVQVPSPMLSARSVVPVREEITLIPRRCDPPPPAPSSTLRNKANLNGNIDYISYTRGSKNPPTPPSRSIDECDSCGTALKKSSKICYDPIFEKIEPIRLNLVSTGKILSEASRERDTSSTVAGANADCPPPPAPLHCEGSIRRLQHAFHSSSGNSGGSSSSLEQLPFANENCGTIKSKDNGAQKASNHSQPQTPRKSPTLSVVPGSPDFSWEKTPAHGVGPNGNVLSDIGFMLQNLTDELDAMLEPARPSVKMPPFFPVTK
ncbi:CASK interacting protein 1, variant 2 [Parelaphostrongylus tenuis]|uniref:CASK interacting protein 1, variant 2 n=1 Tax=Parelaphostrongylus tenuis TaxID=148309 RepID=A0AAD5R6T1_PARTN|nr:CASK interacting protein 1, variant 2 [Parelaphostrongylus tenuis]